MNSSNIFGRQQGSFQVPSNTSQNNNMFQSFSQPSSSGAAQNVGFGQTSTFGQQPVFGHGSGQTPAFGQTPFGQTPSFGQNSGEGQSSSFSSIVQAPTFGQPAQVPATIGFGVSPPSTGQSQVPAFGQVGPTPAFGLNNSQLSAITTGGPQPSFGPSSFRQPSAFSLPSATSSSGVSVQSNVQSSGFGTKFSFKPPNEAVFKPIFSVSPEPSIPQSAPEPLSLAKPATSGTDSSGPGNSGFSLFTSVKPSTLGFSFSQPGAAPSVSITSANVSQTEAVSGNPVRFTFSQPANPASSSCTTTADQPITFPGSANSFNFSAKVVQPQTETKVHPFSGRGYGQPSFGFRGPKPEQNFEGSSGEAAFGTLMRGMKRKEEPLDPNASQEKSSKVDEPQGGAEAPRHPSKRPLLRTREGGLFRTALSGLLKTSGATVKKEDHPVDRSHEDRPEPPVPDPDVPITPPRAPAPIRHILENAEKPGEPTAALWCICSYYHKLIDYCCFQYVRKYLHVPLLV